MEDRCLLSVTAELVTDINLAETRSDASPFDFFPIGELVYFTAHDPVHGSQLWRTDGTDEGTFRLTESNSPSSGRPFIRLTDVKGKVFFANSTSEYGRELWKSDGTVAGTTIVKDIVAGDEGSRIGDLQSTGEKLFFEADDGQRGWELWTSDGTSEGTKLVADINKGTGDGDPHDMFRFHDLLVFTADDGEHGRELWVSDGTAQGTRMLRDFAPGSGNITPNLSLTVARDTLFFHTRSGLWKTDGTPDGTQLIFSNPTGDFLAVDDILYFAGNDRIHGIELWRSDGTRDGTYMVQDILPGAETSRMRSLTDINGTLYFSADDGQHGWELWKSDGTEAGTVLVKDIVAGEEGSLPNSFTAHDGLVYFTADDDVHGRELWKTDGTAEGTALVFDTYPGVRSGGAFPVSAGATMFFSGNNGVNGGELWKTNGTAAGTVLIKDIRPGDAGSSNLRYFAVAKSGLLFFGAEDGVHGTELWVSDGTTAGTRLLDINRATNGGVGGPFVTLDGRAFFSAFDTENGSELWTSDGTAAGTRLVADIWPGQENGRPKEMTVFKGRLFFLAGDPDHGREVWRTDGTREGTVLVKDINPGNADVTDFREVGFVPFDGLLYFVADDGASGRELWRTDGTEEGTSMVRDLWPGDESSEPAELVVMNDMLFFRARGGDGRNKLWRSDGTAEGTVPLKDAETNTWENIFPTPVGDRLFFRAHDEELGTELWKTDGTVAGTVLVRDIRTVPHPVLSYLVGSYPYGLTSVGGTLYFSADDGVHGKELWKSDGTEAGTMMVRDINPSYATCQYTPFMPPISCWEPNKYLTEVAGTLFFSSDDGIHGRELWRSDGTEAGTVMVKDIGPKPYSINLSSMPIKLTGLGDALLFLAEAGGSTYTSPTDLAGLWRSDGTEDGTFALPGARVAGFSGWPKHNLQQSDPRITDAAAVRVGDFLLFAGFDEAHGSELWRIPLMPGDTNLDFIVDQTDLDNVRNHFGHTGDNLPGDTNADGRVDIDDLNAVRNNFGTGRSEEEPVRVTVESGTPAVGSPLKKSREIRQRAAAAAVDRLLETMVAPASTTGGASTTSASGRSMRFTAAGAHGGESSLVTSSSENVPSIGRWQRLPGATVDGVSLRRASRGHRVQVSAADHLSLADTALADWAEEEETHR